MKPLQQFYIQQEMRETVKEYLINHLKEITIKKAFNGEPTDGVCEAKNAIQNAFKQLDDTFGTKIETKAINTTE